MSETDYNARLYEKMKAEQDKYRDWLLHQEPSEILRHTYEYTMREDIVMCMEELELEPEKARALLRSPCPLSDVYKEFRDRETEHKYIVFCRILKRKEYINDIRKTCKSEVQIWKQTFLVSRILCRYGRKECEENTGIYSKPVTGRSGV